MKYKVIAPLTILSVLTGCAATPQGGIFNKLPPETGEAALILYRPDAWRGSAGAPISYINGKSFGQLSPNSHIAIKGIPGNYHVEFKQGEGSRWVYPPISGTVHLKSNETKYLRLAIDSWLTGGAAIPGFVIVSGKYKIGFEDVSESLALPELVTNKMMTAQPQRLPSW